MSDAAPSLSMKVLVTINCRWCRSEMKVLKRHELRPDEKVCDDCKEIVQAITDYNKERRHD